MIRKMPNKNVWKHTRRKETFSVPLDKKKAEERERQINYFKSRNK